MSVKLFSEITSVIRAGEDRECYFWEQCNTNELSDLTTITQPWYAKVHLSCASCGVLLADNTPVFWPKRCLNTQYARLTSIDELHKHSNIYSMQTEWIGKQRKCNSKKIEIYNRSMQGKELLNVNIIFLLQH